VLLLFLAVLYITPIIQVFKLHAFHFRFSVIFVVPNATVPDCEVGPVNRACSLFRDLVVSVVQVPCRFVLQCVLRVRHVLLQTGPSTLP